MDHSSANRPGRTGIFMVVLEEKVPWTKCVEFYGPFRSQSSWLGWKVYDCLKRMVHCTASIEFMDHSACQTSWSWLVEALLYVHRNRRFIGDGSPGRPPQLSHSSWTLWNILVWLVYFYGCLKRRVYCTERAEFMDHSAAKHPGWAGISMVALLEGFTVRRV